MEHTAEFESIESILPSVPGLVARELALRVLPLLEVREVDDVFVVRSATERPELRAAELVADELAFTHPRIARALLARGVPFDRAVVVLEVGDACALVEVGLEPRVLLRETPADTERALDGIGGGPLDVTIRLEGASLDVVRYAWCHPGASRAELGALLLAAVELAAEERERAAAVAAEVADVA